MHTITGDARGLVALTRVPTPAIAACQLTFMDRAPIDFGLAAKQHSDYVRTLRGLGLECVSLPLALHLPDAVFVEDIALLFDELAILASPCRVRRDELLSAAPLFARYRDVHRLPLGVALEGGDVLCSGRRVFIGESARTTRAGIDALANLIEPYGYEITPVPVADCLHLSTGASFLDSYTVLLNPDWIARSRFAGFDIIETAPGEPWAANAISIAGTLIMPAGMPRTRRLLECRGYDVRPVDISEFQKSEAGVTCMGLIFRKAPVPASAERVPMFAASI